MSVRQAKLGAVCAAALGALAIAGCGGGDEPPEPSISADIARTLNETLNEVESNVEVGSCVVALDKVQELEAQLNSLSSDVDAEVLDALQEGALNLGELVSNPSECESPEEETTTEETTTEETTTEETTTEEETTTTAPTTPTTPTTPTAPTTPTVPPDAGGGISPSGDGL